MLFKTVRDNSSNLARALVFALLFSFLLALPATKASAIDLSAINNTDNVCDLTAAGYLGTGTSADPWQISDSESLWELAACDSGSTKSAKLIADITVSQAVTASVSHPIGSVYSTSNAVGLPYIGTLNGNGHSITDINMSSTTGGVGLFANLGAGASISNLSIYGAFSSTGPGGFYSPGSGALASYVTGNAVTLTGILNFASVTGNNGIGGLVGAASSGGHSRIFRSANFGAISGRSYVGGLIGMTQYATVQYSYNAGAVTGTGTGEIGGLIGYAIQEPSIRDSFNVGTIIPGNSSGTSGLIGGAGGGLVMERSYNAGPMSGAARDGLTTTRTASATATSVYTTEPSAYPGAQKSIQELQSVDTFVGWDFATVWGFGDCTAEDNNGMPMLRTFAQRSFYYTSVCGNFVVDYQSNGGSAVSRGLFSISGSVSEPEAPTKSGYVFSHWSVTHGSATVQSFPYSPAGGNQDGILYANWIAQTYSVSFEVEGGSAVATSSYVSGGLVTEPSAPNRTGYNFAGWSQTSGGSTISFSTFVPPAGSDLVLYAIWDALSYSVTFDTDGGSSITAGSFNTAGSLTAPADPQKSTFTFIGWSDTSGGSTLSFPYFPGVTQNITLYTIWGYAVTFDSEGGSAVTSSAFRVSGSIQEPADPVKSGYDFAGWSPTSSGAVIAFPYSPVTTGDVTLYAVWTAVVVSNPGGSGTSGPSYAGPTLALSKAEGVSGTKFELSGTKLGIVTKVLIADLEIEIISQSDGQLSLMLPVTLEAGTYDLILVSSFGSLSVIDAVRVRKASVESSLPDLSKLMVGKTKSLPNFVTGQKSLSTKQSAWLKDNLEGSGLTKIVCTGVIMESMTMAQKIQVRKLAKATCVEAAKYLANPSIWYQSKLTTKAAYIRKVMVTFKG